MAKPSTSELPTATRPRVDRLASRAGPAAEAWAAPWTMISTVPSPGTVVSTERGMMPVAASISTCEAASAGAVVIVAGMPRPGTGLE
jgi:hypothetical protein